MRLFSTRDRPVHLGPYPLERLRRCDRAPDPVPPRAPLAFDGPAPIVAAMADYQATMDAIRDGLVNGNRADCPVDPVERARHLKAFGYFSDAALMGIGPVPDAARLGAARRNPGIDALARRLDEGEAKTLASGIDVIMADLRDAVAAPPSGIGGHGHAIVVIQDMPRPLRKDEPGTAWIDGAEAHRAALRASETAVVLASYLRVLGWDAVAHTATSSEVELHALGVAAGVLTVRNGVVEAPFLGRRFGIAAVTTDFELAHDAPLDPRQAADPRWWLGIGTAKSALSRDPFARRAFRDGPHPFETLKRVDRPTTFIDEANVPRVPKRADLFARAQFGDLGPAVQKQATAGHYVRKSAPSAAQRRMLGAFTLLQDGPSADGPRPADPRANADNVKAAAYWLGVDAVGISRCPAWTWYSHDARGEPIDPPHDQAISMVVDQGFETMEGASGDDWISVAQSMRAYLRFSLLGGVLARLIRDLGWKAKAHTVIEGEVLQPPLLLLAGLGEVSRIGEVILNPFLGPRLKSGVITTDMPLDRDRPIDFGLQRFCEGCNKCARECPSGAITAGPKRMFNGYEIWKSDSQKCATYRITTPGGAMCGRCMKTCPWNLEGLFAEAPFRWTATHLPAAAPVLARIDDALGRGGLNPVKKWWWDLELQVDGAYRPTRHPVNARGLQTDLELRPEDQTLAVYPAPLAPHPHPYPDPMDREAGIAAHAALLSPKAYRARLAAGDESHLHRYTADRDAPVIACEIRAVQRMSPDVTLYELVAADGSDLPEWQAGAHVDVVVAPEYLRQYSLTGDPADRTAYRIGVLREEAGRGGSALMHRIFRPGRRVFVSKPINHFPLVEEALHSLLMAGGIGVTPMIAMAHRLHALGRGFDLHYSIPSRARAGFLDALAAAPWADRVHLHVADEGTRADLPAIVNHRPGTHVYACGPDRYMSAVMAAAAAAGFPETARHLEYFAVPETPERPRHPFTLRLSDGREVAVAAEESATDALARAGVQVDVKCADGICGVCACRYRGAVDHRDFVLSNAQRETRMILCQSRAAEPGGIVEIEL
ncbi:4Fe-4S dicluster domain-containing protein [Jannaschia ovalis]|uniref:Reductive dehalogenase domain-containing protein n=1 Tax=Jannaschia ovalis TaxID=3038773 RepID=A0ABY8LJ25_9RHOB|nr:4Fe-4S dicluster domain-containing protein [Jannaschia sp. GRR-S6-38]WGH80189.1 reductive dehalogenase domain-containing protein [Jannaschia sp. GRR-S6-38]